MIIVGVDGSEGSRRALEWAYREARLRGCAVEVVTAWTGDERSAEESRRHIVDGVRRALDSPAQTSTVMRHGEPVDVLVQASAGAELLVVGSHNVTGLRHAGHESVSEACARLASCPCVVVPPPEPPSQRNSFDASTAACVRRSTPSLPSTLET